MTPLVSHATNTGVSRTQCTEALAALGFTALEAEVYAVLVEHSPASAYKVAREVGKAAANVYKAVDSLQRKGAILVEESSTRLCRAIPPSELIHQLEHQFAQARSRAQTALARLTGAAGDERVYELGSSDQVLTRARAMIRRTERVVLCDLFPEAAVELREELDAAARRGRRVCVQVYRPAAFDPRVTIFLTPNADRLLQLWPGQWLNIVVDAREHLLAFLRHGLRGVHQAVYSESVYLSLLYASGLSSEMLASAAETLLEGEAALESLRQAYAAVRASVRPIDMPGYTALLQRFGGDRLETAARTGRAKPRARGPAKTAKSAARKRSQGTRNRG
jgi:HTH-type transcriptional regulator, sugar sensing transcriptional regulator